MFRRKGRHNIRRRWSRNSMPVDPRPRPFLTADWRYLAILNYAVDPGLLASLTPPGTELDQFDGKTYISLVGFRFQRTRVLGMWIPFHSDFDEVNLRFYVKRMHQGQLRRGVVFVREIVPRWAIAKIAQVMYHENYIARPMQHHLVESAPDGGQVEAEYRWRDGGTWSSINIECSGPPTHPTEGSIEQFITEHYWGYVRQPDGGSIEYRAEHVPWRVWHASRAKCEGDMVRLYGAPLAQCLTGEPDSAFLAEGSSVAVYPGRKIA
jgi:uncharacterized protein YqjF (DUF2071 family)